MITQQRKGMIAQIHIAKKQLGLDDINYRGLLMRVTGKSSCKDLGIVQLEKALSEMKKLGFKAQPPKRAKTKELISTPQAQKIRALWLSLWNLGVIEESSEQALEAFVYRICKIKKLQWLTPSQADKVMKALYGWLQREGWKQPTERGDVGLRAALITAQLIKLGVDYREWCVAKDLDPYCLEEKQLNFVIQEMGKQIRRQNVR